MESVAIKILRIKAKNLVGNTQTGELNQRCTGDISNELSFFFSLNCVYAYAGISFFSKTHVPMMRSTSANSVNTTKSPALKKSSMMTEE